MSETKADPQTTVSTVSRDTQTKLVTEAAPAQAEPAQAEPAQGEPAQGEPPEKLTPAEPPQPTQTEPTHPMGILGKCPLEIREMVYEYALEGRVLSFFDDRRLALWISMCPLGPPPLARVCSETWRFCSKKYEKMDYRPHDHITRLNIGEALSLRIQRTWFYPQIDMLLLDYLTMPATARERLSCYCEFLKGIGPSSLRRGEHSDFHFMLQGLLPFTRKTETVLCLHRHHISDQFVLLAHPRMFATLKTIAVAVPYSLPRDNTLIAYVGNQTDKWCYTSSNSLYTIPDHGYRTIHSKICLDWMGDHTFMNLQEHWALRVLYWAMRYGAVYENFCLWAGQTMNNPSWRHFVYR